MWVQNAVWAAVLVVLAAAETAVRAQASAAGAVRGRVTIGTSGDPAHGVTVILVGGNRTVTTGDGSITLRIPEGFNAELDAESGDGTVSAAGSAFRGELDDDRQRLRGRLGAGGRSLRLRSGDGAIRVIAP